MITIEGRDQSFDNPDVMVWAMGEAYRMGLRGENKATWTGAKLAGHLRPLMTARGFQHTALRHAFSAGHTMADVNRIRALAIIDRLIDIAK